MVCEFNCFFVFQVPLACDVRPVNCGFKYLSPCSSTDYDCYVHSLQKVFGISLRMPLIQMGRKKKTHMETVFHTNFLTRLVSRSTISIKNPLCWPVTLSASEPPRKCLATCNLLHWDYTPSDNCGALTYLLNVIHLKWSQSSKCSWILNDKLMSCISMTMNHHHHILEVWLLIKSSLQQD
jgi:hypothetical protein